LLRYLNRSNKAMMKPLIVWVALLCVAANATEFVAYPTRLTTPVGPVYTDKYQDLVVTFADTPNRLEFAAANGYQPQWRTPGGVSSVENLFPGRNVDPYCDYSFVRLVECTAEKIVVHWRHFKDIDTLTMAKQLAAPDSLIAHGFTGVVHELFTIHPDGTLEREVRAAANTRYEDWTDARLAMRQNLALTNTGITHGAVTPGQKPPFLPRAAVPGNAVKAASSEPPARLYRWTFDEGLAPHDDQVRESKTNTACGISGLMTRYKKGVSGTALALDGYYTGVSMITQPATLSAITAEAWVALDAYPYSTAPLVHQSKGLNAAGTAITDGWYLGIDAYGKPTIKAMTTNVNGTTAAKSVVGTTAIPLYQWTHICATVGGGNIKLYVNGAEQATTTYTATASVVTPSTPLLIGRNNEMLKATDLVRSTKPNRNLAFVCGLQGLLDEVSVYSTALTSAQVTTAYNSFLPADRTSDLAKGVLPGNTGVGVFGATYQSLAFSEVWDPLSRDLPGTEIVVKFDKNPCTVAYWRGTNYAPNWVTDNNRWMADQSSEGGSNPKADDTGCSEHMTDKQTRHCRVRIIENTPARVLIHWRYPSIGVRYVFASPYDWSDEYYTIYPDGTGVRKVIWNNNSPPGFQDCQFLTSPGQKPLDVMDNQAMTLMNPAGTTEDLTWTAPNTRPTVTLGDALVELHNSKGSIHKVFAMFQDEGIGVWGDYNSYIAQPFAGPWNHWPMSLCPSDGRRAVAADRVTHFSVAANDGAKGSFLVLYGFSNKTGFANNSAQIKSLLPLLKSWKSPPALTALNGCTVGAYRKETREFPIVASKASMAVRIAATAASPLVNPCFTVRNWGHSQSATIGIPGATDVRQGTIVDTDGTRTLVVWAELLATSPVDVTISGANL
jgi:hypothetical protein